MTGEARIKAASIRVEENILLDFEKSLLQAEVENVEEPDFIKRVNVILGLGTTSGGRDLILEPTVASSSSEWVAEAKKELMSGKVASRPIHNSTLEVVAATSVELHSLIQHPEPALPVTQLVNNAWTPPPSKPLPQTNQEVKVTFAGLQFSGRLVSEDGQYCEVIFPDGRKSRLLRSQIIR